MVRHLREVVAVCLVVLMLPRMISFAGAEMSYAETTVFRDDFESYSTGAFPTSDAPRRPCNDSSCKNVSSNSSDGWILKYDGLGYQSQRITNQTSYSPAKSLQLIGAPMWASAVDRDIDRRIIADKEAVGFEACVRVDDYGYSPEVGDRTTACICFANRTLDRWGRLYSAIRFLSDGKIYAVTAVTEDFEYLQDYSRHQWYKVRAVVDIAADRFDVWIDGQLRGSFTVKRGHASEIAALNIASGHATSRVYFDDVEVFFTGSREVTFSGRVLANRPIISFYSIDIRVDEVLYDRTGEVRIEAVLTVWSHRDSISQVENPSIGDRVEVFGRFSGNDTRAGVKSQYVDLEASQHYLRKTERAPSSAFSAMVWEERMLEESAHAIL